MSQLQREKLDSYCKQIKEDEKKRIKSGHLIMQFKSFISLAILVYEQYITYANFYKWADGKSPTHAPRITVSHGDASEIIVLLKCLKVIEN